MHNVTFSSNIDNISSNKFLIANTILVKCSYFLNSKSTRVHSNANWPMSCNSKSTVTASIPYAKDEVRRQDRARYACLLLVVSTQTKNHLRYTVYVMAYTIYVLYSSIK